MVVGLQYTVCVILWPLARCFSTGPTPSSCSSFSIQLLQILPPKVTSYFCNVSTALVAKSLLLASVIGTNKTNSPLIFFVNLRNTEGHLLVFKC